MKFKALFIVLILVLLTGAIGFGGVVSAAETQQQSQFAVPIMVVNTSFLNVRTGPGTQYTVLITVVGGTELPVLGVAADRVWYQVSTAAGVGWVNIEYTLPRGDFSNVPTVKAPEATMAEIDLTGSGEAAGSTQSTGATGPTFSGQRAWGVSVILTHWGRSMPSINAGSSVGQVQENLDAIYPLVEAQTGDGIWWYRVDIPEIGLAWVEAPKSQIRPFGCVFYVGRMNSDVVLEAGPDGSGTIDGTMGLQVGDEAYIIDDYAGKYKLELFDGNTGWVPKGAVSVREPGSIISAFCASGGTSAGVGTSTSGDMAAGGTTTTAVLQSTATVVINTGFLNIRSGPGAQYSVVSTVPGGTELAVLGFAPDGVWYLVAGSFGRGWVNSEFTLFRGDGSNLPIIREFVAATITQPIATITNAVTLYAAPDTTFGVLGALSGPLEANVVARTAASDWLQINTVLGFGWVRANEVTVAGDLNLAPVVGG